MSDWFNWAAALPCFMRHRRKWPALPLAHCRDQMWEERISTDAHIHTGVPGSESYLGFPLSLLLMHLGRAEGRLKYLSPCYLQAGPVGVMLAPGLMLAQSQLLAAVKE